MATTTPPTDAELNTLVLAYLALIGIDLSVLPLSDPSAPADQTRVLASARSVLRNSVPVISNYLIDVQENLPVLYPAPFSVWTAPDDKPL